MNVRLFVLGLLAQRPMHGYLIGKTLEESRASAWAEVLPGSIYHALGALEREGLVRVQSVEKTGRRSRAVYEITRSGKAELRRLAEAAWDGPPNPFPTRLYSALTFSDVLPTKLRLAKLAEARRRLEDELSVWTGAVARKSADLPPRMQLALENARAHLALDLELVRAIETTESGSG